MTINGLQIWILTGLLSVSMGILGFFSYNMYQTFEQVQKSVNAIANDIAIIKYTQSYYSAQQLKHEAKILEVEKDIQTIDKRVTKLEYKR